jgi:hypothetical protein
MQAAVREDDLRAGPQHQMEGVAQHDLRADAFQFLGCHRLHGAVGAHGHEGRRFDDAARHRYAATARSAFLLQQFELHQETPGVMNIASP